MSKTGEDETASDYRSKMQYGTVEVTAEASPAERLLMLNIHSHDGSACYACSNDDLFLCQSIDVAIAHAVGFIKEELNENDDDDFDDK